MVPQPRKQARKKRAPSRIEYIPVDLRGIPGVEQVTTVRQLKRLLEYCHEPQSDRPTFLRLGSSVHSSKLPKRGRKPSATYAVDVDGVVSVIRRIGDPRRMHLWMSNDRRPWNISRHLRSGKQSSPVRQSTTRIVTLASFDADASPTWMGLAIPEALRPDGRDIHRVWACDLKRDAGGCDREYVVEGRDGWWDDREVSDLVAIREADRVVICAEDATLWLGPEGVVEVPQYCFADMQLIEFQGQVVEDLIAHVTANMRAHAMTYSKSRLAMSGALYSEAALRLRVEQAIRALAPLSATADEVRTAAEGVTREVIAEQEVVA